MWKYEGFYVHSAEQMSEENRKERNKRITGTKVGIITGNNIFRNKWQLKNDIVHGPESIVNEHILRGIRDEPIVRNYYKNTHPEYVVEEMGIIVPSENPHLGYDADGIVTKDGKYKGIIEIKSRSKELKEKSRYNDYSHIGMMYYDQMMFGLYCTGLEWCDYIHFYNPGNNIPSSDNITIERIYRNDKYISYLLNKIELYIDEFNIRDIMDKTLEGFNEQMQHGV
jgi:hypothetical protein